MEWFATDPPEFINIFWHIGKRRDTSQGGWITRYNKTIIYLLIKFNFSKLISLEITDKISGNINDFIHNTNIILYIYILLKKNNIN